MLELVAMAVVFVVVTALTFLAVPRIGGDSIFLQVLLDAAAAAPLLAAMLLPFHLRRLRRGLKLQWHQRERA